MAIKYYKFFDTDTYTLDLFPNEKTRDNIYAMAIHNGVLYGGPSDPFLYYYKRTSSYSTRTLWAFNEATEVSTRIFTIGKAGEVSTDDSILSFGVDEGSTLDTLLSENGAVAEDVSQISGRYRFNDIINHLIRYLIPQGHGYPPEHLPCIINFAIDDQEYIAMIFNYTQYSSGLLYANSVTLIKSDETFTTYTLNEFISTFAGSVIDFGDGLQTIQTAFYNWIMAETMPIYPYTYTVKAADGTVLASMTDKPPMRKAELSTVGERVYLTLTGSNGVEYSMDWTHVTPPQKIFNGLGYSPNDKYTSIPTGAETDVVWNESKDLYELYGKYVPPLTTFSMDLMKNSAEKNRVDKSDYLTIVSTISGALRQECSIVKPSVTIQASSLPTFNYVHIPIFNRYYFVTGITSVVKDLWRIDMDCDVLMTYRNAIAGLSAVIGRQENSFNAALVDTQAIMSNKRIVSVTHYPNTWLLDTSVAPSNTTKQILLNVVGSEYGG